MVMKLYVACFSPTPAQIVAKEQKDNPNFEFEEYHAKEQKNNRMKNLDNDRKIKRMQSKVRYDSDVELKDIEEESNEWRKSQRKKEEKKAKDEQKERKKSKAKKGPEKDASVVQNSDEELMQSRRQEELKRKTYTKSKDKKKQGKSSDSHALNEENFEYVKKDTEPIHENLKNIAG